MAGWKLHAVGMTVGLILAGAADQSIAQVGANRIQRPIDTPSFSPYLNMFRSGDNSGPVLNYFGMVRPQVDAMQQSQQFGQNLQSLQAMQGRPMQQFNGPGAGFGYSQLGMTGHPVVFQSYRNAGGGGAASGGGFDGGGFSGGGFSGGGFSGGGFSGGSAGVGGVGGFSGHPAAFGTFNQVNQGF